MIFWHPFVSGARFDQVRHKTCGGLVERAFHWRCTKCGQVYNLSKYSTEQLAERFELGREAQSSDYRLVWLDYEKKRYSKVVWASTLNADGTLPGGVGTWEPFHV